NSAIIRAESGVDEAGLSTSVLPVTSACVIFHSAIVPGTFQGVMAAHTPIGSRLMMFSPQAKIEPECWSSSSQGNLWAAYQARLRMVLQATQTPPAAQFT